MAVKRTYLFLLLAALLVLPVRTETTLEIDWVSRYVWRGFDLYADNHQAMQPCLAITLGESGFSMDLWSSFALTGRNTYGSVDEIDVIVSYDFPLAGKIDLAAGLAHYGYYFAENFSFRKHTTQEIFLAVAFPEAFLSPSLTLYYDFNLGDGPYAQLRLQYGLALGKGLSLDLSAALGYNGGQFIEHSGFSDLNWRVAIPLRLGAVRVIPHIDGSIVFLQEVNANDEWWFGLTLGF